MTTNTLHLIDFVSAEGEPTPGLVSTHDAAESNLRIDEKAAVLYATTFKEIDYVFFRRFSDGRSSQISAYVVDNSDGKLDDKALAELHSKVWLHGTAPLLYIFWPSRIDILTCARGPDFWDLKRGECQYKPTQKFEIQALNTANDISNELSRFSALRLADGTFWDEPSNTDLADYNKTAHQMLIQAVVDADTAIQTNIAFDAESKVVLRKLLLLMVL